MDGDGRYELRSWSSLDGFLGLRRVAINTVLNWTADSFVLNTPLTRKLNRERWKALPDGLSVSFYVDEEGIKVQWDRLSMVHRDFVISLFEQMMLALALGEQEKALTLMRKHLHFDNDAQRYLFLQEVIGFLHGSMEDFDWDAIRLRNGWFLSAFSDEYCDFKKEGRYGVHCIWDDKNKRASYVRFDDKSLIVMGLFRALKCKLGECTCSEIN